MSQPNPLASLSAAEVVLVGQVRAATALVRGVGCGTLDAAMSELCRETIAAKARVESARHTMAVMLGDLLADLTGFSAEIKDGLSEPVVIPIAPPALALHVDDEGDEGEEMEPEYDAGGTGCTSVHNRRVALMIDALAADPTLSNRQLVREFGGSNAAAREARELMDSTRAVGGPIGGSGIAAASPQKE